MSFGPVSLAELTMVDPAPEGSPTIDALFQPDPDTFVAEVTCPEDADVVGVTLAWVEKTDPEVNPFAGLSMEEILELEDVRAKSAFAGPGESASLADGFETDIENGTLFQFACAATDEEADLVDQDRNGVQTDPDDPDDEEDTDDPDDEG